MCMYIYHHSSEKGLRVDAVELTIDFKSILIRGVDAFFIQVQHFLPSKALCIYL